MTAFAVWVDFDIADANRAEFEQLVRRNAAMSLAHEPGCRRFDVLVPVGGDDRSLSLYEVYDDPKAFDAHTATAHFRAFDVAVKDMVLAKCVRTFALR